MTRPLLDKELEIDAKMKEHEKHISIAIDTDDFK